MKNKNYIALGIALGAGKSYPKLWGNSFIK